VNYSWFWKNQQIRCPSALFSAFESAADGAEQKRPRMAREDCSPRVATRRYEGEMRGLAVIFRCINYMGNSLGKVKILTILKATGSDSVFGPDYAISLA